MDGDVVTIFPPSAFTRPEFVDRIRDAFCRTVQGFIDTGQELINAKAGLEHGDFEQMVEQDLPFGPRTARMLMAVARDPRISNRKHVSVLPPHWGTLYAVHQLEGVEFDQALDAGVIHPEAQRSAVIAFRQSLRKGPMADAKHETCTVEDLGALIVSGFKAGTIYADPPWRYGNQGTRASTGKHYVDGDGEKHPGMSVDEICALPVSELADTPAHLHLWTTNGFLFDAKRVMDAWGFEYKSCFVWVKPKMGIGNYWRVSHEFLLLGTRGNCTFPEKAHKSWLQLPRGKHSAKPERIRHIIERVSPGRRLELFGRAPAEGWTVWGNEIERNLFYAEAEKVA